VKYLPDTNICIDVIRGDAATKERWRKKANEDMALSTIVIFELEEGPLHYSNQVSLMQQKQKILRHFTAMFLNRIPFTEDDAQMAAMIRASLRKKNQLIGPFDTLIAAQALTRQLTVITKNVSEFSRIPKLKIENWHG
jgi:tRNA(fMet)-specific endonuclease VapC